LLGCSLGKVRLLCVSRQLTHRQAGSLYRVSAQAIGEIIVTHPVHADPVSDKVCPAPPTGSHKFFTSRIQTSDSSFGTLYYVL
jgi:hypothetical protein